MLKFKEFLNESLDQPYSYHLVYVEEDQYEYRFTTEDGRGGIVNITAQLGDEYSGYTGHTGLAWTVDFVVGNTMVKSGKGDPFRIMATVIAVLEDFYGRERKVESIEFSAYREGDKPESRITMYRATLRKFVKKHHFQIEEEDLVKCVVFRIF